MTFADPPRPPDIRALARAISQIERGEGSALPPADEALPPAAVLGVTGAPGAGKSTLVDALIQAFRTRGARVAVVATDPSSPFTGGALLGDRVRMQRHALDPDVYVRSMAARGHLGGLARTTREVVRLLGASGFQQVVLETVGVGQSELEVAAVAETSVVVLAPGAGDGVQLLKAGLIEIADIFVINKADLSGGTALVKAVRGALGLGPTRGWAPPVLPTVATSGEGVEALLEAVLRHRMYLDESGVGAARVAEGLRAEVAELVAESARAAALKLLGSHPELVAELATGSEPRLVAARVRTLLGVDPVSPPG